MKKILRFIVLITGIAFLKTNSHAQDLSYYRIDDEDGLPSNEVYQTVQDQFGYIWIACDAGLYRYDGIRFKEFSSNKQNSRSISNLQFDKNGGLWCQNFTGQIFNLSGDSLNMFFDASMESSQHPSYTIDQKNRIWIATDQALHIYSPNGKIFKRISNKDLPIESKGWLAIKAHKNRVICIDKASLFLSIDLFSFKVTKMELPEEVGTRHLFFENNGEIVLFSEQNPQRKYFVNSVNNNTIKHTASFLPEDGSATHYFYKKIGTSVFMGTSNGLMIKRKNNIFRNHIKGMKVSDVQRDREGNYWVSTLQDGIIVIPNLDIVVYKTDNSPLTDRNLYHLNSDGNELLIGTYSGEVFSLSPQSGYLQPIQRNLFAKHRAIRKILHYKGTRFIACGPFLASNRPELNELAELNNIRDMSIMDDRLYFTTPDRTGYIDLNSKEPSITILRQKGGKKIICDPRNKTVFLACTDGLFISISGKISEIKFQNQSIFATSLQTHDDQLWIGTMSTGLLVGKLTKRIPLLENFKHLKGKKIRAIYINFSTLWAVTEVGLNRVNLVSKRNTLFNKQDGIEFLEINDLTEYKGIIYLATIRGLVCFPSKIVGTNYVAPTIRIAGIKKGGQELLVSSLIHLYSDDHGLTINFSSTAFRSRGNYHYEYKIQGYDNDWRKLPAATQFVTITGLPAGRFKFVVRAVNEDGIVSKNTDQLEILVHAPFFQRWWFIFLMVVLLVGIVTLIFLMRIRYLKKQSQIKNRLILSQLTALKAQMNPHFMYNTLSSIQDFIWQNDIKNSNYYLSKFSLLMRKVLDASDSSKISLHEEIEILTLYLELEQLRFGSSFTYELTVDNDVDSEHIYIPAMIIQPFIENAIKHGLLHKSGEKKLKVHFSLINEELHCIIIDNGIGRAKAEEIKKRQEAKHRSFATKATQKRIELLSLYDDSMYSFTIIDLFDNEGPSGTQVELILPFRNS